ncbi:TetR/AcrR family transcriptional regulator [Actinoalloteichus hymeniacidonis]|uniref:Transcriptional regulator, TetR family n=1 Tax=Actinoalloteichus hymeniacidonis TaxID=340345 RepID=A0AAC9MW87_9PSEU|nr:TetR/AcrR family transcriptional regulator [Actinoalloteichus hymeniacidonis]AOS61020.1 transcriptional regulator, TetR family [Actinoalloteichus hymeniacidonis]MBB5910980.1 AcrR family transcriptional regulator [Actinoalloteichus hymeniacidonis]
MASGKADDPDHGVELLWREQARDARPGLTLDRIVRAAIEVADADGLTGLSMRKIADRLGFTSMSLYRHVPGRDHLVDLMRDVALGEPDEVGELSGWRAQLEELVRQGLELRKRHPWLAEVRTTRFVPGPNVMAHYEALLRSVAASGLPPTEVVATVNLIGRWVDAESLVALETAQAEQRSEVSHEQWWGERDSLYAEFDRYPTLTALWEGGGFDRPVDPFEFGLARILDGVELLIAQHRDERRDEITERDSRCAVCGNPVVQPSSGRPRAYCSRACQQRAYRQRRSG